MRYFPAVVFVSVLLAGCERSQWLLDSLFGIKHNVAVLSSTELDVSEREISFTPKENAEVVGNDVAVCVVIRIGEHGKQADIADTDKLLKESTLRAVVLAASGVRQEFTCPGIAWAYDGRISSGSEVSSCVRPSCGQPKIPVGTKITSVSISSKAPMHVFGAYWESDNEFDPASN
jgi:hypothetical protein